MSCNNYSLVDCVKVSPEAASINNDWWTKTVPVSIQGQPCCVSNESQEEKEQTMFNDYDSDENQETIKLNHLSNRLSNSFYTKRQDLQKKYGLVDDDPPATPKDLLARIAAGKYVVSEENMERRAYNPMAYFNWRDPAIKVDPDGFKAAEKLLQATRTAAEDIIVVMSDETMRLKALQEFESATLN